MRIVNRKEFLSLPVGIIYSTYQSHGMFSGLYGKGVSYPNDWVYQDALDSVDCNSSEERDHLIDAAEQGGEFKMYLNCGERDGCYDDTDMFAIYDKSDVGRLIQFLSHSYDRYPNQMGVLL